MFAQSAVDPSFEPIATGMPAAAAQVKRWMGKMG